MENINNKDSYLHRKIEQLEQWERVEDKLQLRAEKAKDKNKSILLHQIKNIQVKKTKTKVQLRHLQEAGSGEWEDIKAGLEKCWVELRKAFLKASEKPR